jgi:hypothetical protein
MCVRGKIDRNLSALTLARNALTSSCAPVSSISHSKTMHAASKLARAVQKLTPGAWMIRCRVARSRERVGGNAPPLAAARRPPSFRYQMANPKNVTEENAQLRVYISRVANYYEGIGARLLGRLEADFYPEGLAYCSPLMP